MSNQQQEAQHAEVARLVEIRNTHGTITRLDYDEALTNLGRPITAGTRGHLRRLVAQQAPAEPPPSEFLEFTDELLVQLAKSATLQEFFENHIKPTLPKLTFSSFYRRFVAKVDHRLRAYLKPGRGGMEAFRVAVLSCLWHCSRFGQAWQMDVYTLPFKAIPPGRGSRYAVPVKLIAIIDDATRLLVGWGLVYCTEGRSVRKEDVCAVLIGAMDRHGIPLQVVLDNGGEFDNDLVANMLSQAIVAARFTPRYRGERKGKIEAFFRSFGRWMVMRFPSWTAGKPSAARFSLQGGNDRLAPPADIVEAYIGELIELYNTRRRHRALGMTPADARAADPTKLRPLSLHKVLRYAPIHNEGRADEFRDVQGYGVNFDGEMFTNLDEDSPGHKGLSGAASLARMRKARHGVRIRRIQGDPGRIGLYNFRDEFICIATRHDLIPTEVRFANSNLNDSMLHHAERLAAAAHNVGENRAVAEYGDNGTDEAAEVPLTLCREIAQQLELSPAEIDRRIVTVTIDDARHDTHAIVIDNSDFNLNGDQAIDVLLSWVRYEDMPLYRLDTPNQSLTFEPHRRRAALADKTTGDIHHIGLTAGHQAE